MIKKYDEFINEEIDWSNIKNQVIKSLDPFHGNIKEIKRLLLKLMRNGVLPIILMSSLLYYFPEEKSRSLLKEVMEEYDDGYGIINKEISSAKSIVFGKISNYKNKDRIIKKLNEIEIRVGKLNDENSLAQFIYNVETKEVCILIDEDHILKSDKIDIIESVAHEMLHYVDYLIGSWSVKNVEIINQSIDTKVKIDKKYATDKLFNIIYNESYETLIDSLSGNKKRIDKLNWIHKDIENGLRIDILKHYDYYTSPEEMFVRINLLRNFMISKGIINDFNQKLTKEHFKMVIDKLDRKEGKLKFRMQDYLIILFLIDFDSEMINKVAKSNIKTNINIT